MRVHVVLIASLGSLACARAPMHEPVRGPSARGIGSVSVRVELANDMVAIESTHAVLRCPCLDHELETSATPSGVVSFSNLPRGEYELSLRAGAGGRNVSFELERGNMRIRTDVLLDPGDPVLAWYDAVVFTFSRPYVCVTTVHDWGELSGGPLMECRCAE